MKPIDKHYAEHRRYFEREAFGASDSDITHARLMKLFDDLPKESIDALEMAARENLNKSFAKEIARLRADNAMLVEALEAYQEEADKKEAMQGSYGHLARAYGLAKEALAKVKQ